LLKGQNPPTRKSENRNAFASKSEKIFEKIFEKRKMKKKFSKKNHQKIQKRVESVRKIVNVLRKRIALSADDSVVVIGIRLPAKRPPFPICLPAGVV